jgi:hypothetical protein
VHWTSTPLRTPELSLSSKSRVFGLSFTPKSENNKYARHVRSSAGIASIVSDTNDKAHWVEAGRCYERFALHSAALGIRNALINQPVEVSALRPRFAAFLGIGNRRPDLRVGLIRGLNGSGGCPVRGLGARRRPGQKPVRS